MLQLIAIATSAARSRIKREKHNEQYVDKWRAPGARLRRVGGARARGPGALCSVECQRPAPSAHWRPPGRAGRLEAKLQAAQTGSEQAWRTSEAPSPKNVFTTEQEGEEEVAKPSARARRLSPKARASPREGPVPLSSGQRAARYSEHGGEGGGGGDGGGGGGKRGGGGGGQAWLSGAPKPRGLLARRRRRGGLSGKPRSPRQQGRGPKGGARLSAGEGAAGAGARSRGGEEEEEEEGAEQQQQQQ
ncbi:unnamed protein product [Prorocentrum cordatum]|uniref:Uncharacterized protein n=1 Tax=Prorocentrum cordatum TaxID=2364126 RepID=A0ABN9UUV8_9DINO|nr:unnamed protein product [Polarella glacialis]